VEQLTERRRQLSTTTKTEPDAFVKARAQCWKLYDFVKIAWPHQPGLTHIPFVPGWHIEFICEHLEAISKGVFLDKGLENRLQINVPPGMMKSLLVSVFWPAWEWTLWPEMQYIMTSYRDDFCRRDTVRMRDLILSPWYQMLFGADHMMQFLGNDGSITEKMIRGVQLVAAGESRISNTVGGFREGIPFKSLTGNRADRVIIDDPHSIETAESEADRERTSRNFRESVPHRINDPVKSAIVLIMQRLHVGDLCGVIEQYKLPYQKIILPMEYEPDRTETTCLGLKDRRWEEGQLLFPQRFPRAVVERDKIPLGPFGVAGQLQQRPYLRGGNMFKTEWFVGTVPGVPQGARYCRHWDLAATKRTGAHGQAWTAGVLIAELEGMFYVVSVRRLQGDPDEVRNTILFTAQNDGYGVIVSLPQDPGQAGVVQKRDLQRLLTGFTVRCEKETGDKIVRAHPLTGLASAGLLKIVRRGNLAYDSWIEPYISEFVAFPGSPTKDQVDATSGAYATLTRGFNHYNNIYQGSDLGIGVARDTDFGMRSFGHPDHSNPDPLRYRSPNDFLDGIRIDELPRYNDDDSDALF
jgi:predicted phage terminase large subunit-like protein